MSVFYRGVKKWGWEVVQTGLLLQSLESLVYFEGWHVARRHPLASLGPTVVAVGGVRPEELRGRRPE